MYGERPSIMRSRSRCGHDVRRGPGVQGPSGRFEEDVEIGNGDIIVCPVGRMNVRWKDRWAETFVAFGEPKDARVLGALTLQELRLIVDPKSHRVRPRSRALFVRFGG